MERSFACLHHPYSDMEIECGLYVCPIPYGVIEARGADVADFLHRMTSNDVSSVKPHSGIRTVLLTEKGRIVDVLSILRHSDHWCIVVSPGNFETVYRRLRTYIVMDDVNTRMLQEPAGWIELWSFGQSALDRVSPALALDEGQHALMTIGDKTVRAVGIWRHTASGRNTGDVTLLLCRSDDIADICRWLEQNGIPRLSDEHRERLRIGATIGQYPNEYNESYNPFEAGLGHLVALGKGCFIGQEVIERIATQNKLKWSLYALSSDPGSATLRPGMRIYAASHSQGVPAEVAGQEHIGIVTSAVVVHDDAGKVVSRALGYIRSSLNSAEALCTEDGVPLYLGTRIGSIH